MAELQTETEKQTEMTPSNERRSPLRPNDDVIFNVAQTAIEVARSENPTDFQNHFDEIDKIERVAEKRVKSGVLKPEQKVRLLKEYHAMRFIADSYDELTGVLDRNTIKRQVQRVLAEPVMDGKRHVYIDLDINGLKAMNENSNRQHTSADEALKGFAQFHMAELARKFGYKQRMGRLSGDEFAIIVENTTSEEIENFFNDIEERRKSAMEVIIQKEGLSSDITAMRAITEVQMGDTYSTLHERTDQQLIAQKQERNRQQLEQVQEQKV